MKFKATQKDIRNGYSAVISIPYCNIQTLLSFESPVAYTVRREGCWGADIYQVGNVAISTGYAPFGNIKVPYEKQQEYEEAARKIRYEENDWDKMVLKIHNLLKKFVDEVTQLYS